MMVVYDRLGQPITNGCIVVIERAIGALDNEFIVVVVDSMDCLEQDELLLEVERFFLDRAPDLDDGLGVWDVGYSSKMSEVLYSLPVQGASYVQWSLASS